MLRAHCLRLSWILWACCALGWTRPLPVVIPASDPRIAYTGVFDRGSPEAPRFAWPATQIRLRVSGRWVRLHLTDTAVRDETPENDWLGVEIDGKARRPVRLKEGKHSYWIAANLSPGPHTVILTKRTEPEVGTVTLHAVELAPLGQLLPPAEPPPHRIEVIGDSISAGYGIEGTRGTCRARAYNQDATRTYAGIAARELGAELVVSAWSGKGILRNYEARDTETMPMLWARSIPTERAATAPDLPTTPVPERTPDLVVVHLGTNDFMRGIPDESAFLGAYRDFLNRIEARAPHATFVLALSPLLTEQYPHLGSRSTLARWLMVLKTEREGRGLETWVVEQSLHPKEGLGCVAHPNLKSQARLGRELAQALRDRLGW